MKLAVTGTVIEVKPIEGADRIHQAIVSCGDEGVWSGVVGKDIQPTASVLVFLQDAILPENPRWAFMEKHKWRVRMARFKGVPSECVIVTAIGAETVLEDGYDMTEEIGVTKYEKPVPAQIAGEVKGNFPDFIPKTDEPNFQRVRDRESLMAGWDWVATIKYDGTSGTAWVDDEGELHVCSRNLELKEFTDTGASNVYWQAARKYNLERMIPGYAIQFEICGPGIQGNPAGFPSLEIRAFTLWDIKGQERLHFGAFIQFCAELEVPIARIAASGHGYLTDDSMRELADKVCYPNGKQGEGFVIRSINSNWSMKSISLNYKG